MEACCLITRLRRPCILWRLMFSPSQYQSNHNIYVFPTFILVGPLLWYFFNQGQHFAFTVVDPCLHLHCCWWAILHVMAVDSFLLGWKGDLAALLFTSHTSLGFISVTYSANTGQRYTLVSHAHERCNKQHGFSMLHGVRMDHKIQ